MSTDTYTQRRGRIEHYFDRTAADAWARLTSDAPVGRIRATVRAGRDRMRAMLLEWLPADLHGLQLGVVRLPLRATSMRVRPRHTALRYSHG